MFKVKTTGSKIILAKNVPVLNGLIATLGRDIHTIERLKFPKPNTSKTTTRIVLKFKWTSHEKILERAHELGFRFPGDYIKALILIDIKERQLSSPKDLVLPPKPPPAIEHPGLEAHVLDGIL